MIPLWVVILIALIIGATGFVMGCCLNMSSKDSYEEELRALTELTKKTVRYWQSDRDSARRWAAAWKGSARRWRVLAKEYRVLYERELDWSHGRRWARAWKASAKRWRREADEWQELAVAELVQRATREAYEGMREARAELDART